MKKNSKNFNFRDKKKLVPLIIFISIFLIGLCLLMICGFAPFGNKSFASADANIQYMDFLGYVKNIFLGNDSINFSYNIGLGNSGFGLFCYYLSSPLNLIFLLSNYSNMYTIFNLLIVLKLALCGLFLSIYLIKRFENKINPYFVFILSLSYSLMQYNIAQSCNIMWLDGVYLLPLIMLGVYKLVKNNKITLLSISVAISILFNWYTGGINCLLAIFWFFVEMVLNRKVNLKKDVIKKFIVKLILFIFAMLIGVMISSILFIPNVVALRSGTGSFDLNSFNVGMNGNLLSTLNSYALGATSSSSALSIFCGSFVFIGFVAYFISKDEKYNKIVLLVTAIISLLFAYWQPFIYAFSLLKTVYTYWFRYSYVIIFVFIFISAMYYSKLNINKKNSYILISIFYSLLLLLLNYCSNMISNSLLFYTIIFNILVSILLCYYDSTKVKKLLLIIFSITDILINAILLMNIYKLDNINKYSDYTSNQNNLIKKIQNIDKNYYRISELTNRLNFDDISELSANLNESVNFNYMSIKSYTSAPNNNEIDLLTHLGYRMEGERMNIVDSPIIGSDSLLGVKYLISPYKISTYKKHDLNYNGNFVYENPYCLPFAVLYDNNSIIKYDNPFQYQNEIFSNIFGKEILLYKEVSYEKVQNSENNFTYYINVPEGNYALYSYLPWYSTSESKIDLNSVYGKKYSRWLANTTYYVPLTNSKTYVNVSSEQPLYLSEEKFYILDLDLLKFVTDSVKNRKIESFTINKNKIKILLKNNSNKNLLLTISNNKGWTAKINSKPVKINNFAEDLMSLNIPKGNVKIELAYVAPGLKLGICVTIIGMFILIIYNLYKRNK